MKQYTAVLNRLACRDGDDDGIRTFSALDRGIAIQMACAIYGDKMDRLTEANYSQCGTVDYGTATVLFDRLY